jgi:hypothetical protein
VLEILTEKTMGIKPGPKRIAESTGRPDRRQRDNKDTPRNTPSLRPHKHKKCDGISYTFFNPYPPNNDNLILEDSKNTIATSAAYDEFDIMLKSYAIAAGITLALCLGFFNNILVCWVVLR